MSDGANVHGVSLTPGRTTTLQTRQVIIHLQKYPGNDAASGVADVEYFLSVNGVEQRPNPLPRTDASGRIVLDGVDPNADNRLHILGSVYRVIFQTSLPAPNTVKGIKARLNILGYRQGNPDGENIDEDTDYAILNFQADNEPLSVDSVAGSRTQPRLNQVSAQ
jgi:hypothetical protein